jgi:rRNA maturation endonuclease Nob1
MKKIIQVSRCILCDKTLKYGKNKFCSSCGSINIRNLDREQVKKIYNKLK